MSNRKYQIEVTANGDLWAARITRQVSARKSVVSKQQDKFLTKEQADDWAKTNLDMFVNTQQAANTRHGSNRNLKQEVKRLRSERRAKKTESAKASYDSGNQSIDEGQYAIN